METNVQTTDQMEMFGRLVAQMFVEEMELAFDRLLLCLDGDEAEPQVLTRTAGR